jgi:hypothetical protein
MCMRLFPVPIMEKKNLFCCLFAVQASLTMFICCCIVMVFIYITRVAERT